MNFNLRILDASRKLAENARCREMLAIDHGLFCWLIAFLPVHHHTANENIWRYAWKFTQEVP